MIFSGCEQMQQQPFDTVFIHGLIRDEKGVKMSKSLGNGIDPLEVIDQMCIRDRLCIWRFVKRRAQPDAELPDAVADD